MRYPVLPLLLTCHCAGAIRLSVHGRQNQNVHARGNIVGTSTLTDSQDVVYYANISLGGAQFEVLVDTGSSDLYVSVNNGSDVPNSKSTGKSTQVTYAGGKIEGPIKTADLVFLGYNITDQAFIQTPPTTQSKAGYGLIGLGPQTGSEVRGAINSSAGDPVLDRIFRQNTTTPNYLTILLGRSDDPTDTLPGDITVGEILPGYENITSQPKLNVSVVPSDDTDNQHWQTLLDADGIIGPDGNAIDVETSVSSTSNKKQLTAVFDTGFSIPQVPSSVAKAIYSNVPGAKLQYIQNLGNIWTFPCDKEINVTFKFGGVSIPIHPLDTSLDLGLTQSGESLCCGAFQPNTVSSSEITYDMILGMAFLRNVYMSVNFGDFVDGSPSTTADPYIQFLPTTNDTAEAHSDFVKVRGESSWDPSSGDSLLGKIRAHLPLVIGVCVAVGVVLIGLIVCCLRHRRMGKTPAGFMNFQSSYRPLHATAPGEAYDLHHVGNADPPAYASAWDHRY